MSLSILFAATGDIAIPTLRVLASLSSNISLLTSIDKKRGRGMQVSFNPIKEEAIALGIKNIFQFETLDLAAREQIVAKANPNFLIAFAYGKFFGPKFLSLFSMGAINIHPSLLPKYRGAAPLLAAVLNGDRSYGISIQKIFNKLDTGDILVAKEYPLNPKYTTSQLTDEAALNAADLLSQNFSNILSLYNDAKPQGEVGVSYSPVVAKEEGLLDFKMSASKICCKVRAYQPWPKTYTYYNGKLLFIYDCQESSKDEQFRESECGEVFAIDLDKGIKVKCLSGSIYIKELQLEGKKRMDFATFLNGNKNLLGVKLGGIV